VVLVTSRDSLAGLVARHGARRVDLGLLSLPDAVALLEALIGDRARADPAATAEHRATLAAVTVHAATSGWPGHATRLAATVFRYLEAGCHYTEADTIHRHARDAARHAGDRAAEATSYTNLGNVAWGRGRYQQAVIYHQRALALSRDIGDRKGEAIAAGNLGVTYWRLGRYDQAVGYLEQGLARCEAADRTAQALALSNLGFVCQRQGRYAEAAGYHQRALDLSREIGDLPSQAAALNGTGEVLLATGQPSQARAHYASGDLRQARSHWHHALARYTQLGLPDADDARAQLAALSIGSGQPA
jgi:tetratricopeptide (TPR) repeat protein